MIAPSPRPGGVQAAPGVRSALVQATCLACTVRGCGLPLQAAGAVMTCAAGHAFDIARAGYVNLLQPQDRRSQAAGDAGAAVAARSALLARGIGRAVLTHIAARSIAVAADDILVDLGCGGGELAGGLAEEGRVQAIGIDLSTMAVERAARRFPSATWVVANADRRLPLLSGCAAIVTSVHGRRNPAECARVLAAAGTLIVAVPAPDDLRELRERISGQALPRERANAVIEEHRADFALARRDVVREQHDLDREALLQLLQGTYRGGRLSAAPQVDALDRLTVTLASEVLEFARREPPPE